MTLDYINGNGFKVYDGKCIIPDNITKIDDGAFEGFSRLKEVIIPEGVIEIGNNAFKGCVNLKKITVPDSVTKIGRYAFCDCNSLREIIIPNSVTQIAMGAFKGCGNLKKVIISENIPKIEAFVFKFCFKLEEVIIHKNAEKIGISAFEDCFNLKNVTISDGVVSIQSNAFCDCQSLEKIMFPKSVNEIEEAAFWACIGLRDVVINYEYYSKLKNIVNQMCVKNKWKNNLMFSSRVELDKINFTFIGSELTGLQKYVISNKLKDFGEIKFESVYLDNNNRDEDNKCKEERLVFNEEINSLLDDIDNIINNLSDDVGDAIKKKVSLLIEEYNKNIIEYNKYIDKDEENDLELGVIDPEVVLISKLTSLKVSLSDYNNLINNLSKISEYENIIDSKVDKMPDNLNSIEDILKSIVYLVSKLDDKKKEEIYNRVKNYLDFAKKSYQNNFDTLLDKNSTLLVIDFDNPLKQLQINLLKLLDDVILYSKKVSSYLELLEVLKSNEIIEYKNSGDIKDMIISIRHLISGINYIPNRDKLNNLFDNIINKYIFKIDEILKDTSSISSNDYIKLEKELRNDLIPLLELLKLYGYLDDICIQLSNSRKALEIGEYIEINEDKIIESLFIDINNCLINDTLLSIDKKNNEVDKLLNVINKWLNKMDTMDSCDDKNKLLQDIFKDIYKIKINLDLLLLKKSKLVKKRKLELNK